jgi:hypothetical protein
MMTEILKCQLVSVFVFVDDILVCSRTLDDHLEQLLAVFKAVQEADIWLKGKKCTFVKDSVDYLSHIKAVGLLILGNHVSKLLEMRRLDLEMTSGLCWVQRVKTDGFWKSMAATVKPLTSLLKKGASFV